MVEEEAEGGRKEEAEAEAEEGLATLPCLVVTKVQNFNWIFSAK